MMLKTASRRLSMILLLSVMPGIIGISNAVERDLIAESADMTHTMAGERAVMISGLVGEIRIRKGPDGEIRYMAIDLDRWLEKDRLETEVALWKKGNTLHLEPKPGEEQRAVVLEILIPEGVSLGVNSAGSLVTVSGLRDDVEISGDDLNIDVRSIGGRLDLDLTGGSGRIQNVGGQVIVTGTELNVEFSDIRGPFNSTLRQGALKLQNMHGDVKLDLHDTVLSTNIVQGIMELRAAGARADLAALMQGADIRLRDTRIGLLQCEGDISIETDSDVSFRDMKSDLHVNNYGGSLIGEGNEGIIEVITEEAKIRLESIQGPVRVKGDGIEVDLKEIEGEVMVFSETARIEVRHATGPLTIENEAGDVEVQGIDEQVNIVNRDGDVRLSGLKNKVDLEMDGNMAVVAWEAMQGTDDSIIRNETGAVTLHFSGKAGGTVQAVTQYGRIESQLPEIVISEDEKNASGVVNDQERPEIDVYAGGDIVITFDGQREREAGPTE